MSFDIFSISAGITDTLLCRICGFPFQPKFRAAKEASDGVYRWSLVDVYGVRGRFCSLSSLLYFVLMISFSIMIIGRLFSSLLPSSRVE